MRGVAMAMTSPPLGSDEIRPDQVSEDGCEGRLPTRSDVMTELIVCFFTLTYVPALRLSDRCSVKCSDGSDEVCLSTRSENEYDLR